LAELRARLDAAPPAADNTELETARELTRVTKEWTRVTHELARMTRDLEQLRAEHAEVSTCTALPYFSSFCFCFVFTSRIVVHVHHTCAFTRSCESHVYVHSQVSSIYLTAQQDRDAAVANAAELKAAMSQAEQRATAAESSMKAWQEERNAAGQEVAEMKGACCPLCWRRFAVQPQHHSTVALFVYDTDTVGGVPHVALVFSLCVLPALIADARQHVYSQSSPPFSYSSTRDLCFYLLHPQQFFRLLDTQSKAEQRAIDAEAAIVTLEARVLAAEEEAKTLRAAAAQLESEKGTMVGETSTALAAAVEARAKVEAELAAAKASFAKKVCTP